MLAWVVLNDSSYTSQQVARLALCSTQLHLVEILAVLIFLELIIIEIEYNVTNKIISKVAIYVGTPKKYL